MTRSIDLDCPKCARPAGTYCNGDGVGVDLCTERITAARMATRTASKRRVKARNASSATRFRPR